MKKIISFIASLFAVSMIFAAGVNFDMPENIEIVYSPSESQVCISYTCPISEFERVAARDAVMDALQSFIADTQVTAAPSTGKTCTFLKDSEKFFRDGKVRKARFSSMIQIN